MNVKTHRRARDKNEKNPAVIAYATAFHGKLKSSVPVIVAGMVEGDCLIENVLIIQETGIWLGNIHADMVIVDGKVKGDIIAENKIEIGPSGQISGNIRAGSIAIASGAVIDGDMKITEYEEPIHFEEKRTAVA